MIRVSRRLSMIRWSWRVSRIDVLTAPVGANGGREAYLRAEEQDGAVVPASNQDSSLLFPFATANALIRRPVNAPALKAGDEVECVRLR